uniref:Putative reverse transcriptase domain-containing protein n=1 Tax=Tanacetum cinerariifolium TaxID=118510 RepID=A0A699I5X7_TANCI|nr:putative reverse transcriptase domain-containing protein [Tanacetum cinerariifolium]
MRELVVKYKAEKVCYEEMVKMPLVDLKVLEDESFRMCIDYLELSKIDLYSGCHQMRVHGDEIPTITFRIRYGHFKLTIMPFGLTNAPTVFMEGARVTFEDEFGATEEREVSCESQQGRSRVKRKLFGSYRNNMGNEPTLALPEGIRQFCSDAGSKENMFRACVRNLVVVGILTFCKAEIGESKMIGLELEQETTNVFVIKERLKEAKDRVIRYGKKGKLAPRYVGPSEILERIIPAAYWLRLLEELTGIHDTFHVSNLKKCLADASLLVPLDEIKVDKTLRFV